MGKTGTYRKDTQENMEAAIHEVLNGTSIREAAFLHDILKKTLSNKINNKHLLQTGRQTAFTAAEGLALINYIKFMSDHGFPLTIRMIKSTPCAIAKRFWSRLNLA